MASKQHLSSVLALLMLAAPAAADAGVYKYISNDGTIHFTDNSVSPKYSLYSAPRNVAYSVFDREPGAGRNRYDRAGIDLLIKKYSDKNGLDPVFVTGIVRAESAFDPNAVSSAGAMGLMQLMPATARRFGVSDPFLPEENIRAGTSYMKELMQRYNGDKVLALAAYNAGEDVVSRYSGVPPYPETVGYIEKVLGYETDSRELVKRSRVYRKIYRYVDGDGNILLTDTPRGDLELHPRLRRGK